MTTWRSVLALLVCASSHAIAMKSTSFLIVPLRFSYSSAWRPSSTSPTQTALWFSAAGISEPVCAAARAVHFMGSSFLGFTGSSGEGARSHGVSGVTGVGVGGAVTGGGAIGSGRRLCPGGRVPGPRALVRLAVRRYAGLLAGHVNSKGLGKISLRTDEPGTPSRPGSWCFLDQIHP